MGKNFRERGFWPGIKKPKIVLPPISLFFAPRFLAVGVKALLFDSDHAECCSSIVVIVVVVVD